MKSALCLFGQPRTMEYCYPSQKKHLLDVYHPDVFIVSDEAGERMRELYNPVAMEIKSQDEIWQEVGERKTKYINHSPETKPWNDVSVNWKGWRGGQLLKDYEADYGVYDVVFISRFDVKFFYIDPVTVIDEDTLYVPLVNAYLSPPDPKGNHYGGYSTQLCWCSSRVAHILLDLYNAGDRYYQAGRRWHTETILKWMCDENKIKVKHVNMSMMIIRGTSDAPRAFSGEPLEHFPEFL